MPEDAPCTGAEAVPSGIVDSLYFSSARKTGERVSPKPPAGTVPQFPKRLSNDSGRSDVTDGAVLAEAEPQFPKRSSNAPELSNESATGGGAIRLNRRNGNELSESPGLISCLVSSVANRRDTGALVRPANVRFAPSAGNTFSEAERAGKFVAPNAGPASSVCAR